MNNIFLIAIVFFISATSVNAATLIELAKAEYEKKGYAACTKSYQAVISANEVNFSTHYNAACCAALSKNYDKAFKWLDKATDAYPNLQHYQNDPDFKGLKNDIRWEAIIKKLRDKQLLWDSSAFNQPWQQNLSMKAKVAGLSKFWMEAKYNFVFFDKLDNVNWDSLYLSYLDKVIKTNSTFEYYLVLSEFSALLKDGHTGIVFPQALFANKYSRPGIRTRLIEEKVVIVE